MKKIKVYWAPIFVLSELSELDHTVHKVTYISLPHDPRLGKPLKTLWQKEKMLVTSIFSFSHDVFILATLNLLSANAFNFAKSKRQSFDIGLKVRFDN